jgi:predicted permease
MSVVLQQFRLALPLFSLVLVGYALMRLIRPPVMIQKNLDRLVFTVGLPAVLFPMMSGLADLPPVDARLPVVFFGGCIIVFIIGRLAGHYIFKLDGVSQSVFAIGGIFSNNVLLGIPLAAALLGPEALPSVAMVLVFNALILWTLVTVSVEWSRHGSLTLGGLARTLLHVLSNPIIAAILGGTAFGLAGLELATPIRSAFEWVGRAAIPCALVSLGMGLATYNMRGSAAQTAAICTLKLILLPLVVWGLAWGFSLSALETQVAVLLSSLAVGANVYLMSRQFNVMEGPVAASLLLSTALSAVTSPAIVALATGWS